MSVPDVAVEKRTNHRYQQLAVVVFIVFGFIAISLFNHKNVPANKTVDSVFSLVESRPTKIEIPVLKVESPIVELGLNPDKTIEVPKDPETVGWYKYLETPGEIGPAVMVGHLDDEDGPAIFYELNKLEAGNIIRITREDGSVVVFQVDSKEEYNQDQFPTQKVYGKVDYPSLRLITCSGRFSKEAGRYSNNLVVFASLVNGK